MNTEAKFVMEPNSSALMERVLMSGDLSKLSSQDRLFYYTKVCESVGLNPLTRPFDYLLLNNKLTLYAKRDATDQLRKIHGVSVYVKSRDTIEGVYVVTATARDASGREDESTGAVNIAGLKGDMLANALMKAETKAKRRVTLSICGLGLLDETELETIPNATVGETPAIAANAADGTPASPEYVQSGKHKGKRWEEVGSDYLQAIIHGDKGSPEFKALCQKEVDRRKNTFETEIDADIPI